MPSRAGYFKKHRATLLTALPGVLIALIATWWFLFQGPGSALRHARYMRPDTAVRAVLCPARVQSYVSSLAPTVTHFVRGLPKLSSMQGGPIRFDWLHKMPLEMAFLFDQSLPGRFEVTLFMKEHPAGEPMDELIDNSTFLGDLSPILWSSPRIRRESGGCLLADGQLAVPPDFQEEATRFWPQYKPVVAPAIHGNHFFELGINNCNGALMQLQGALINLFVPWADMSLQQQLSEAARGVIELHAFADLAVSDRLEFTVEIQCGDPGSATAVAALCGTAAPVLAAYLQSMHQFTLDGSWETDGARTTGKYVLGGFEPSLRHALGG